MVSLLVPPALTALSPLQGGWGRVLVGAQRMEQQCLTPQAKPAQDTHG